MYMYSNLHISYQELFTDISTYCHVIIIDVSGGHSASILNALRSSIDTSRAFSFQKHVPNDYQVISHHHAFYMATLGGAKGEYLFLSHTNVQGYIIS